MTANQVLIGVGLILVLAVGSQVRGIVGAATASTFSTALVARHIGGEVLFLVRADGP